MAHLIDKDALVAEIERRINFHKERGNQHDSSICDVLYGLSYHIDTLEVKEVDLEKEINDSMPSKYCWSGDGEAVYTKEQMRNFAKHFYELGLKVAQKEEQV